MRVYHCVSVCLSVCVLAYMIIFIAMVTDGNVTVLPPYDCVHVSDRAKEIVKVCLSVCMSVFVLGITIL